ncbi:pyridoxine 5'-phosphate synthase [Planctomycetota bacterium]
MKLGVNVDHVATVREARGVSFPDPAAAAVLAELGGADGITIHLREDQRHIKERDVRLMKQMVSSKLNLEMSIAEEVVSVAEDVVPDQVTIVPEKREELTTEGGLDVIGNSKRLSEVISRLQERGVVVTLFVEPSREVLEQSKKLGADGVELHTGRYADAAGEMELRKTYHNICQAAVIGKNMRLHVAAGHGLHYRNIEPIAKLNDIEEVNIGHSIVARAVFVGMERAVREMKELLSIR